MYFYVYNSSTPVSELAGDVSVFSIDLVYYSINTYS